MFHVKFHTKPNQFDSIGCRKQRRGSFQSSSVMGLRTIASKDSQDIFKRAFLVANEAVTRGCTELSNKSPLTLAFAYIFLGFTY